MKKLLSLVIVVLFGALLARTCLYTVNERELRSGLHAW